MSTNLFSKFGLSVRRFYGGRERGRMLQIDAREAQLDFRGVKEITQVLGTWLKENEAIFSADGVRLEAIERGEEEVGVKEPIGGLRLTIDKGFERDALIREVVFAVINAVAGGVAARYRWGSGRVESVDYWFTKRIPDPPP